MIAYTLTQNSITALVDGELRTIRSNEPAYALIKEATAAGEHARVEALILDPVSAVPPLSGGDLKIEGGKAYYLGQEVPAAGISDRIVRIRAAGGSTVGLENFLRRLSKNPSWRSTQQLFTFLGHCGIPIDADGTFLAYKGLNSDFKDNHTGKVDNSVGTVHDMARNLISDDPEEACHYGFHVGALAYAKDFAGGGPVVVCRVAPEDVVCVPRDHSAQKMRVCHYVVAGHWSGEALSDTSVSDDENVDVVTDEDVFDGYAFDEDYAETLAPKKQKRLPNMSRLSSRGLLDQTIDDLRAYAKKLKIIGASKIPGGKAALVKKITKIRGRK